ncbi:MAG TPA: LamG domain-containing protein [Dongiaceae bacterium]|nr:LamG domain-containing protein [Dongiaceae bacterium]
MGTPLNRDHYIRAATTSRKGFTIVELIVVIIVIGILVGVVIIGYGNWRQEISRNTINSDLIHAGAAMESNANFSNSYPASVGSVYTASSGAQLSGGALGTRNFCISESRQSDVFFMTKQKIVLPGVCPLVYFDPSKTETYPGTGTVAYDLSGNSEDGTFRNATTDNVAGPTYVANDGGGVFAFDGTGKYYTPDILTLGPNMTWFACAKTVASSNGYNMFMGQYLPYFGTYTNGTSIIFSDKISGTQRTLTSTSPAIPLNTWNCYAFTTSYDGANTTMTIYINGTQRVAGTYTGQQDPATSKFTVGDGNYPALWYPFNGRIGDVAIYPRTFSASEIQGIFGVVRGKYGI